MSQVLDYSVGFPGAEAIKSAGYDGAVRYIGFPDRRKCTNRGELNDFSANQLGMALVFENNTSDWRYGFTQGQASARRARDHANAIGFPADRPIYMAVDRVVATSGEFATMVEYLRGANTSLGGPGLTGVYGEADVIDRARDAGVAAWFWQTAAWSRGRRTAAHLFQRIGAVTVGGISCDVNDILEADWGQHNAGDTMQMTPQEYQQLIKDIVAGVGNDFKDHVLNTTEDDRVTFHGPDTLPDGTPIKRSWKQTIEQSLIWDTEAIAAAQKAGTGGPLTDAQVADMALQLASAPFLRELPKDTAAEIFRLAALRFADPQ